MKKGIALILASASATALAVPAAAQDNSAFTGPRIEGIAGYDISKAGSDVDNEFNDEDDQSIDGLLYGVGVGYDVAVGGVVLGAEAELSKSTADTGIVDGDLEDLGFGAQLDTGRDIYVGARAGILAGENMLVYVKGGYTNARYNLLADDGTVVAIQAEPEPLSRVLCDDTLLLARAAYHLGNRHVALEVQRGQLRYQRDHVLEGMLKGLGLDVEDIVAPFNPEPGAYHGHTHSVATPAAPFLRLSGQAHAGQ